MFPVLSDNFAAVLLHHFQGCRIVFVDAEVYLILRNDFPGFGKRQP